jgi:hypothetical protein
VIDDDFFVNQTFPLISSVPDHRPLVIFLHKPKFTHESLDAQSSFLKNQDFSQISPNPMTIGDLPSLCSHGNYDNVA